MSAFEQIEREFVESLALVVHSGKFDLETEYRKGWFDGYAKAFQQITGKTPWQLTAQVNAVLEGSGKQLGPRE